MQVMSNGRVRRTREEWHEIVSRREKSGLSPRPFCRKREPQLPSFYRWQQEVSGCSGCGPIRNSV